LPSEFVVKPARHGQKMGFTCYSPVISKATERQKFLLDTREQLAARFRAEYGSGNKNDPTKANVYGDYCPLARQ
jgi:hypothetical protein